MKTNLKALYLSAAAAVAIAITFTATAAQAIDPPPQAPQQEREWLAGQLVSDMEAVGTFDANSIAQVPAMIGALDDNQTALLTNFYYLTRCKAEQDAYLASLQQSGQPPELLTAADSQLIVLLANLNNQIAACYNQIALLPPPAELLAQYCYASVPGWCSVAGCYVPACYYANGCYVGPCANAAWAGRWSAAVCKVYFDHASHFYAGYHRVAELDRLSRSVGFAKLHGRVVHAAPARPVVRVEHAKAEIHHAAPVVHEVKAREIHAPAAHVHAAAHVARPAGHVAHVAHANSGGHGKRR